MFLIQSIFNNYFMFKPIKWLITKNIHFNYAMCEDPVKSWLDSFVYDNIIKLFECFEISEIVMISKFKYNMFIIVNTNNLTFCNSGLSNTTNMLYFINNFYDLTNINFDCMDNNVFFKYISFINTFHNFDNDIKTILFNVYITILETFDKNWMNIPELIKYLKIYKNDCLTLSQWFNVVEYCNNAKMLKRALYIIKKYINYDLHSCEKLMCVYSSNECYKEVYIEHLLLYNNLVTNQYHVLDTIDKYDFHIKHIKEQIIINNINNKDVKKIVIDFIKKAKNDIEIKKSEAMSSLMDVRINMFLTENKYSIDYLLKNKSIINYNYIFNNTYSQPILHECKNEVIAYIEKTIHYGFDVDIGSCLFDYDYNYMKYNKHIKRPFFDELIITHQEHT